MAEDGFWKETIEVFFEHFMALYFPKVYAGIDWSAGFRTRDKELAKLNRDNKTGRRFVDKLVEVRRLDGDEALVLVHIEVQSQRDSDFAQRMWTYYYRLVDRYKCGVTSLALLADGDPGWRPDAYWHDVLGCKMTFRYPTTKLLDFQERKDELQFSSNPFALLTLALLKVGETADDMAERGRWKLQAMRGLYYLDASRTHKTQLLKFIDWAVRLPDELDRQLHTILAHSEEDKKMAYVTSFERIGLERGMKQGLEQGRLQEAHENILDALNLRFGSIPQAVIDGVTAQKDMSVCKELFRASVRSESVEDFATRLKQLTQA